MKLKPLLWTVIVLAILCFAAFWLQRPAPLTIDPRVDRPVLDPAFVAQTARLRLTDQGKTVELARQSDGSWIVPSYYGLPANFSKLSQFINDLTQAKIQRFVTANPERLSRLDFHDTAITLLDKTGKILVKLDLGKNADSGGRFLRYGTESKAYLANLTTDLDLVSKNWASDALLSVEPEAIKSAEIGFASDPPLVVTREKAGAPFTAPKAPAHKKLNADALTSLLRTLGDLRFQDTTGLHVPDADAALAHARTFKLTTFAGETFTIRIGRKPAETVPVKSTSATEKSSVAKSAGQQKTPTVPAKTTTPRTVPAGPVYAFITSSKPQAGINTLMQKRAFQIYDYLFGELPAHPADLFSAEPPAAAPSGSTQSPAASKKQKT